MAFVLEKTPKPGELGYDFYELIDNKVNHRIPNAWVVDKERGVAFFYISNNARSMGDGDAVYPNTTFIMVSKDWKFLVHEEIVSKEKKTDDCLTMKINLRLDLAELTVEFWDMAKEALGLYGDHGILSDYSKFELIVLNDNVIKGVK